MPVTRNTFDPANFMGGREGGVRYSDAMDAGGYLVGEVLGEKAGGYARKIADPLGILGMFDSPEPYQSTSGDRAIDIQRQQFQEQQAMQAPYAQFGRNALAGMGQYQESPEFQQIIGQGTRALDRGSAAGGMYDSSQAGGQMSSFINQATGDEAQRQYQQHLNALRIGQGAAGSIAGAAGNMAGQMGGIYGQQGNIAAQNALNQGQQQANLYQTAGNFLGGIDYGSMFGGGGGGNPYISQGNPLGLTPGQGL